MPWNSEKYSEEELGLQDLVIKAHLTFEGIVDNEKQIRKVGISP